MTNHFDFETVENYYMWQDMYNLETAGGKGKWQRRKKGEPAVAILVKKSTNECFTALFLLITQLSKETLY